MKMSRKGLIALARREAVVLGYYLDSKRVPTCGIGHTAAAGPPTPYRGMTLSLREALDLFAHDLAKYEAAVNKAVKVPLAQHEFDALVSFHFNTGAIARATLVKRLNAGDRAGAARGFMSWVTPPEITGRRLEEQHQFSTGNYGDTSKIPVYAKFPGKPRLVSTAEAFAAPPVALLSPDVPAANVAAVAAFPVPTSEAAVDAVPPPVAAPQPLPAGVKAARPPMPPIPQDVADTPDKIAAEVVAFNTAWDAAPTDADVDTFVSQVRLKWRNYSPGTIDGRWGGMLRGAIAGFLNDYTPGAEPFAPPAAPEQFAIVKQDLGALLTKAEAEKFKRPISEARANPTPAQLAEKAPEVVPAKRNFLAAIWATIVAFLTAVWDFISAAAFKAYDFVVGHKDSLPDDSWSYVGKAKEYAGLVPTSVWFLLVAGGLGYVAFNAAKTVKLTKQAVATGERL